MAQGRGFWVVVAVLAVAAALWLLPDTQHDLSQAPQAPAYPRLMSDEAPKKPILPPTEPFANGWTELSPAAIVEQDAARAARETLERQSREMMDKKTRVISFFPPLKGEVIAYRASHSVVIPGLVPGIQGHEARFSKKRRV